MEFKVGDWIMIKGTLPWDKFQLTDKEVEHGEIILGHFMFGMDSWEHWKPKPGEWCWVFNSPEYPDLRKFIEFNNDYFLESGNINYSNCKPFVGELSSFFQH